MKRGSECTGDEVILEWLRAELNSVRFGTDLRAALARTHRSESIITAADLDKAKDNETRRAVLKRYRGWLELDFAHYRWQRVELNQDEVGDLHYIDYSYWNELSDGTRRVGQAVNNILEGKVIYSVPNDRFHAVAKAFEAGKTFPPVILLSQDKGESAEILEGHLRATGYVLAEKVDAPLRAILGTLNYSLARESSSARSSEAPQPQLEHE